MVRKKKVEYVSKWVRRYCPKCKKWHRVRRSTAWLGCYCPRCGEKMTY